MTVTIFRNGQEVKHSRNLRGILDYARKVSPVNSALVVESPKDASARVEFYFLDGAICITEFASAVVARNWLHARRSWGRYYVQYITGYRTNYAYTPDAVLSGYAIESIVR
jgi:hypothetical protein